MDTAHRHELSRRDLLKTCAAATATAALAGPLVSAAEAPRRPNILFIMTDQMRGDCVGADGNAAIRTPNLDRLAADGALFRHAYSSTPTCTPARAALLTGQSPWNHGMLGYSPVAEKYPVEMPQALRDAGYHTLCVGKTHWTPQRNGHGFHTLLLDEAARAQSPEFRSDYIAWFMHEMPNAQYDATGLAWNGSEAWPYKLPERVHPTHWTGETAVRFIDTYQREEPFFLKVSFHRPHSPYDPPERFMSMYQHADIPKAAVGDWAARYAPKSDTSRSPWHGDFGADQVRVSRMGYYGSISFIDEEVGRILAALERRGWTRNTLVLFTSDHGDMTGDHHLWRKSYAYEPSAKVPMIVRWPEGLPGVANRVCDEVAELRDVLPTFLDAAGAPIPDLVDGASLLTPARGESNGWREFIDLEHDICYAPENHWNGLTDGRRKFIFHAQDGREQFFDLEQDPMETVDLAAKGDRAEEVALWRSRLVDHLAVRGDEWVKEGKLALRPQSIPLSPNYPKAAEKGKAGSA